MPTPKLSPEIRTEAERLAGVAVENPQNLRREIAGKTLEQLDALSAVLEERRTQPPPESIDAMREEMDRLLQSQTIDQELVALQRVTRLARVVGVRARQEPAGMGRTVKRTVFQMLSFLESAPTGILGNIIPGLNVASTLSALMPSFARRNLMSMDIEDAIASDKRFGETINFTGLTDAQFQQIDKFMKDAVGRNETPPSVSQLVKDYLANVRERNLRSGNAQSPITIVVGDMLTGNVRTEVTKLRTDNREEQVQTAINLAAVTEVQLGDIAKYENGVLQLPETELNGKTPRAGTRAELIVRAIKEMPGAETLTVVPSGPTKIEWVDGRRMATLSMGNLPADLKNLNHLLVGGKPEKITTVSIGTNDRIGQKTAVFSYEGDKGMLNVPNNVEILAALNEKIRSLEIGDTGNRWTYDNGEFTPVTTPVPIS